MSNLRKLKEFDFLKDLNSNRLTLLNPTLFEEYKYSYKDGCDYIVCYGRNTNNYAVNYFEGFNLLQDVLNLGSFCVKAFSRTLGQDLEDYSFLINRNGGLFDELVSQVLAFSRKYGLWDCDYNTSWAFVDEVDKKDNIKKTEERYSQRMFILVKEAINIYEYYEFYHKEDTNKDSTYLMEKRLFELYANVRVAIAEGKQGERYISYDFSELLEIAKYQLFTMLVSDGINIKCCPYCNKFFTGKGKHTYCCSAHKNYFSRGKRYEFKRECANCGDGFIVQHQSQRYCSDKCQRHAEYKRLTKKNIPYDPEVMSDFEIAWLTYKKLYLEEPK